VVAKCTNFGRLGKSTLPSTSLSALPSLWISIINPPNTSNGEKSNSSGNGVNNPLLPSSSSPPKDPTRRIDRRAAHGFCADKGDRIVLPTFFGGSGGGGGV
jgi:hypothetical protein